MEMRGEGKYRRTFEGRKIEEILQVVQLTRDFSISSSYNAGHQEQRSACGGKAGEQRKERQTQLRTGKATKTTEKKQLHQRSPSGKKLADEKEPHDHTTKTMINFFSSFFNISEQTKKECSHLMPTMCERRQLPRETVARRSSCLTETQCRNSDV